MLRQSLDESRPFFESGLSGGRITRTASGTRGLPSVQEADVKVWDPSDWVNETTLAPSPTLLEQSQMNTNFGFPSAMVLPVSQPPGLSSPLSSSFTQSVPLTPQSAGLESSNFFAPSMSRQESLATRLDMFRIDSQMSNGSDYTRHEAQRPYLSPELMPPKGTDFSICSSLTPVEPGYSGSARVPIPFQLGHNSVENQPGYASGSPREGSRQQESMDSPPRPPTSVKRPLKPKVREDDTSLTIRNGHEMIRVESENGVTEKCKIAKTSYIRPQKQKVMCPFCERREGFRGEHELRRHQKLVHSDTRTGWICLDNSQDGNMLGGCKNCRAGKVYGAYYNAAAHLRRVHFHPRRDGRRARGSVSRAGKGGGDDPPMSELKKWMKKVEVKSGEKVANPSTAIEAPLSDQERNALMSADGAFGADPTLSYPSDDYNSSFEATDLAASTATLVPDSTMYPWIFEDGLNGLHQQPFGLENPEMFDLEPFS
jgi:hypothetical protein